MDLSKISTEDLKALQAGDLSKVSTEGLRLLQGQSSARQQAEALTAKQNAEFSPTSGMSGAQQFAAGYGAAAPTAFRGLQQLSATIGDFLPGGNALTKFLTGKTSTEQKAQLQADIDESKRLNAPLMATGAGMTGNVLGNVALTLPSVAVPGAATLPGAAAVGGALGFVQPVASDESRLTNTLVGGGAGAGGVAAGRVLKGAYQATKALAEPFTEAGRSKIAGRVIQRFADDPAAIAQATSAPTITGAVPTLAEQTGDAGLARLQDALRSVDPQINNQIGGRLAENNAARVASLQSLAGDQASRDAAELARSTATRPLYQQATKADYTVDAELANLLQRPAVKQAMERAKTLAANQNRSTTFGVEAANPFSGMGVPTQSSTQIKGMALQDLKMAMDEMLSDPASGFTGKAGNTLRDLRGQLVNWMESANPAFKEARQTYAAMSRPLNAMDVGEEISRRATSNTSDLAGNPRMQANALLGMLRDEPGLLRRATGRKELSALSDVLDPQQMELLRAVASEADRAAAVGAAGNGPGSATAQRMASQNVLRQLVGPTGLPQSWAESALANTVVGKPLNLIYGGVAEPRIQRALAEAALDPAKARQFLNQARLNGTKLPPNALQALIEASGGQAARSALPAISLER
jgi:hypothetical protein